MKTRVVCVLGGTGFVGRHLVAALSASGWRVRVVTRRRERHRDLLVLPGVDLIEGGIDDVAALRQYFSGAGAVINLVGILHERRRGEFQAVHVDLPKHIVSACRAADVPRLLHMSALHADAARGASRYLRSKGEGENIVHTTTDIHVTSFRPSVIFGPGDSFFNRFACLIRVSPGLLPLACPDARFAPVYVADVVAAMVGSLDDRRTYGQRYDLCGPAQYTLRELVEFTARVTGRRCRVIGLSRTLSALQARVMGALPGKLLTYDNYLSMQVDSVCSGPFPDVFGVTPATIEAVVPRYLGRRGDPFDAVRRVARHD